MLLAIYYVYDWMDAKQKIIGFEAAHLILVYLGLETAFLLLCIINNLLDHGGQGPFEPRREKTNNMDSDQV